MKAVDLTVDRILEIAEEVRQEKRTVQHGLAEMNLRVAAANIAFKHTVHQKYQKIIPSVPFFDNEIKPERKKK
jgi:hypothetical protein